MADFLRALPFTLGWEGGKCNLVGDSGGRTNCGVSTPALTDFNNRHPELNFPGDTWALTPDQISLFYRLGYWKFDGVASQVIATKVFDMDVNDGLPSGIKLAQESLVQCGYPVAVDDSYGPATESAINSCDPGKLMNALVSVSTAHYESIAAQHPNDQPFLSGWLRRASAIPT